MAGFRPNSESIGKFRKLERFYVKTQSFGSFYQKTWN